MKYTIVDGDKFILIPEQGISINKAAIREMITKPKSVIVKTIDNEVYSFDSHELEGEPSGPEIFTIIAGFANDYNSSLPPGGLAGQIPVKISNENYDLAWTDMSGGGDISGGGDMLKTVYDPTGVSSDTFDMDNHVESATNKHFTQTEKTKLGNISDGAEPNVGEEYTTTEKTKLSNIEENATIDLGNHTATQDLDLSSFNIVNAKSVDFAPQNTPPTYKEGRTWYDSEKHAFSYYNDIEEINVNTAQEGLFRIYNGTAVTINNGEVITPDPTTVVSLADAYHKDKSRLIAVATHDIPTGTWGYATKWGQVGGLDTSAFLEGQIIYLGAGGVFTDVIPTEGGYVVLVGVVDVQHATEGIITVDTNVSDTTIEVTDTNGFPPDVKEDTTMIFVNGTRTFTITPSNTEFRFYEKGQKYMHQGADSITISDIEGYHLIHYSVGVLSVLVNPTPEQVRDIVVNKCIVSYIYWDSLNKQQLYFGEERHGISMSPKTHEYLHRVSGSKYLAPGLQLNSFILSSGDVDSHAQFSVGAGTIVDEDIETNILGVISTVGLPIYYMSGTEASPVIRRSYNPGYSVLTSGSGTNRMVWNELTGGNWQLTESTNNDFVLCHVFAINDIIEGNKLIAFVGQGNYTTGSNARTAAESEIFNLVSGGFISKEYVAIGTVIFQTGNGYTNAVHSRVVQTSAGENYIDWRTVESISGLGGSPSIDPKWSDEQWEIYDELDSTKRMRFLTDNLTTAQTRIYEVPDKDGTVALLDDITATQAGAVAEWSSSQVVYVGKHGLDTNDGLAEHKAFLTFGAAIAYATSLVPSAVNRILISCRDGGIYTEDLSIISWIGIQAPGAVLVGNTTLQDNTLLNFYKLQTSSGTLVTKSSGTLEANVICSEVVLLSAADGIVCSTGIIVFNAESAEVTNGTGFGFASAGSINIRLNTARILGTGHLVQTTLAGQLTLSCTRVTCTGSGHTLTLSNSSTVNASIASIDCYELYNVGTGCVLKLLCPDKNGLRVNNGIVRDFGKPSAYPVTATAVDMTIDILTYPLLLTYQSTPITITIPASNLLPNDGTVNECIIYNLGSGGTVTIQTSGTDVFQTGTTQLQLNKKGDFFRFGQGYPTLGQGIATLGTVKVVSQVRYNTTWAAANFLNPTAVPFNTTDKQTDPNVFEHNTTTVSRIDLKTTGNVVLGYSIAVDSTGGGTYNVNSYLRIDGTTVIPGTNLITGNYGGEDQSMGISGINYEATAGSYVELVLDHTNLTGNANNIVLTANSNL